MEKNIASLWHTCVLNSSTLASIAGDAAATRWLCAATGACAGFEYDDVAGAALRDAAGAAKRWVKK